MPFVISLGRLLEGVKLWTPAAGRREKVPIGASCESADDHGRETRTGLLPSLAQATRKLSQNNRRDAVPSDGSRLAAFVTVGYLSAPTQHPPPQHFLMNTVRALIAPGVNLDAGPRTEALGTEVVHVKLVSVVGQSSDKRSFVPSHDP